MQLFQLLHCCCHGYKNKQFVNVLFTTQDLSDASTRIWYDKFTSSAVSSPQNYFTLSFQTDPNINISGSIQPPCDYSYTNIDSYDDHGQTDLSLTCVDAVYKYQHIIIVTVVRLTRLSPHTNLHLTLTFNSPHTDIHLTLTFTSH